ncbi:MAG TPA: FHA domain-containing protein [Natronosporangium sp.]
MMPQPQPSLGHTAHLVVLAPDAYRGRRIPLVKDELVVGREAHCDVRFDDPYLSRCHAVLRRHGDTVYVQDLYSRAGTLVNGTVVIDAYPLHPGDIVSLADLRLRFEAVAKRPDGDRSGADSEHPERAERERYAAYLRRRERLLRRAGATWTVARWLTWLGFGCLVGGAGLFAAGVVEYVGQVTGGEPATDPEAPDDIFGRDLAGIPAGWLGAGLAGLGLLMIVAALLLFARATTRRRQIEQELPDQPPGTPAADQADQVEPA